MNTRNNRRELLRLGAAAAAAAAIGAGATAVALESGPTPWKTGAVSVPADTQVTPLASYGDPEILRIRTWPTGTPFSAFGAGFRCGLSVYDTVPYGQRLGSHDYQGSAAILATSSNGSGLVAKTGGTGSAGNPPAAVAGYGLSPNAIGGAFKGGRASLILQPPNQSPPVGPGAPTTGAHTKGEIWIDGNANLWVCNRSGDFSTSSPPAYYQLARA